jgi:HD-GYP domain-containing protein (c-di-GMP phosphodiesterase class II)
VMRGHPVFGAQMVSHLPGADTSATVVILEHHMRYDGQGYPARKPWRQQHLASRIVAVADSYDAMTSARSYSAARVQDEAMSMLAKSAGTALDPALVRLFVRMLGVYPPRSVVRLSDGRVAVVLSPSAEDPLRPTVLAIAAANGDLVEPYALDLGREPAVSVLACIDPKSLNVEVDDFV